MSTSSGTIQSFIIEAERLLKPLKDELATQPGAKIFFGRIGILLTDTQASTVSVFAGPTVTAVDDLTTQVSNIIRNLDEESYGELAENTIHAIEDISTIISGTSAIGNQVNSVHSSLPADEIAKRIVNYLLFNYIEQVRGVNEGLELLGLLDRETFNIDSVDPANPEYEIATFRFERIGDWFSDPAGTINAIYDWGKTDFDGAKLFSRIEGILSRLGLPVFYDDASLPKRLDLVVIEAVPKTDVTPHGLLIRLKNSIIANTITIPMGEVMRLELNVAIVTPKNTGFYFLPNGNVGFQHPDFSTGFGGGIILRFILKKDTPPEPFIIFGEAGGSRFEMNELILTTGTEVTWTGSEVTGNFQFEAAVNDLKVIIDASKGDGFLSKIMPGTRVEADFDLVMGVSTEQGFYIRGSSSIEIRLPMNVEIGPIGIEGLTIAAKLESGEIPISLGADIRAELGPLVAVVQNMGVRATFSFPPNNSGNLGPLNLSLGFKPPNGLGLSLDAGAVKGGGYLYFDFDREEYAGALELVFSEWIALKAIGVITTKMPDGSKGFSMVIIITAEFGSGLQLGLGFTLLGVGGIIGINRVVNVEPLKDGVRTGAIESVLFPQDVVANAPRIISDLKAFFPVREGQFLIGPMAKIGYGTPTLASLSLGLIIEFPDVNITILGVLKIVLPDENADVLRLQVNFLGRIEPANSLLWFYAELYDSRVLFITLEGGMGLLVNWGNNSNFVFSVGGFHPQFTPPPLPFPAPPRLAVNILNETYARVRIEGYFAVTSNSVQFGARVEVFFGVSAFNIDGHFGFDALFQFDPFYFSFSLSVSLSVKLFGMGVFSIGFSGLLEGPTPWHIKGQGSIGFLFFSVSVPFEETWGEQPATPLPPIEIFPLIEREFNAITNWQAVVPTGSRLFVSLRKLDEPTESAPQTSQETDKRPLVLHPVGSLRISQRKMPLDFKMDKLGNQMPADVNEISIAAAISGADAVNPGVAKEKFARGEYQNLDQAKKLSEPAFELYNGGLELKADGAQLKTSMAVKRIIRYETIIIDSNFKRHAHKFFEAIVTSFSLLAGRLFGHFVKGSVITKSTVSAAYQQRIQPNEQVITVELPKYSVALMMDNSPLAGTDGLTTASFASKAEAFNFMQSQITGDPKKAGTLHIIPNTELNQSTAA
jgi:hypothetical protein